MWLFVNQGAASWIASQSISEEMRRGRTATFHLWQLHYNIIIILFYLIREVMNIVNIRALFGSTPFFLFDMSIFYHKT